MFVTLFEDEVWVKESLTKAFRILDKTSEIYSFETSGMLFDHLTHFGVDIIILDLLTEDDLGLQVIQKVRDLCPSTFIAVYSAVSLPFIYDCVLESGVDLFIPKRYIPGMAAMMILKEKIRKSKV